MEQAAAKRWKHYKMKKAKNEFDAMIEKTWNDGSEDLYQGNYSGNIYDAIHDVSDGLVDIYYSDLFKWASENVSSVNDGIDEFGSSGDMIKDLQAAQYINIERGINDELEIIIHNYAIIYIINHYDELENITDESLDELNDRLHDEIDSNSDFSDIENTVDEIMKSEVK